jgi:hypothetical protein
VVERHVAAVPTTPTPFSSVEGNHLILLSR